MTKNLINNNISRRKFMSTTTSVIAGAGLLSTSAQASTPKKGGTLRIALNSGSTTDTFDPRTFAASIHVLTGRIVCNQLTWVGNDGKIKGELAESWEQQDGGKKWTIKLRRGVKFSNGKEFDSADAVYSLKMHADKNSKSGAYGLVKDWESIETDGKYAITIILKKGNQGLPWVLNDYHLIMFPDGHNDWTNPIGTGAYVLTSYKPGVQLEFKNRGDYWKENSAHFDKVRLTIIKDNTARQNALISGQVDIIDNVVPKTAKLLQRNSRIDLVLSTTGKYFCHNMNTTKSPFSNNDFRLAIKHSTDRKAFIDNILAGFGEIGNDNPIAKGNEFYNPNLPQYEQDTDKAKYYLNKSGFANTKIQISTSTAAYSSANEASVLLQESLKKSGINAEILREPDDGYWSNVWMKKPFVTSYWGSRPTAALTFSTTYHSSASWNDTYYKNSRLDSLIDTMNSDPNYDNRKNASWEAQEIIHKDGGQLIPGMPQSIDAKNSKLKNVNSHPVYEMDDFRVHEKAWFE